MLEMNKVLVPGALMLHKCIDIDGDYHKEVNADRLSNLTS